MAYRPGKFLNAAADKASDENERMAMALRRADGRVIGCVQIAGWVARRIVCYIKPGQAVAAGERFGHIRFGSRTDLYLPPGARLLVAAGQRMIGGETVMAELDPVDGEPRTARSSSRTQVARDGQRFSHRAAAVARLLDQPADPQRADPGGAVLGADGDPLRAAGRTDGSPSSPSSSPRSSTRLDGRVARRLGVTSRFGAELDLLSDFLCFGVSPALVLYLASLKDARLAGLGGHPDVSRSARRCGWRASTRRCSPTRRRRPGRAPISPACRRRPARCWR